MTAAVTVDPRIIVEDKGSSLAVHYRLAPELGPLIRNKIAAILDRAPAEKLEMLCGKAVIEIKPPNFNKGIAVCELMKSPPFAQRIPLFVGDDVTDESVFAVLPALGGFGYSVGREVAGVDGHLRRSAGRPRLAHRPLRPRRDETGMNDFGLDLAVIGNGRTAALVDPSSRIVWWCYPRFDGDPIFSRLLAGDEEKGFCDVVLEGMVEFSSDPRFLRTVEAIERELLRDNHVMRYASEDDFGLPETAFLVCRFWLIDVLWDLGRREQAREMFNDALKYRNRYGLLAEDIHPRTGELWGNFPQTYSMAGLILTAMRLSRSWEDRFWRG